MAYRNCDLHPLDLKFYGCVLSGRVVAYLGEGGVIGLARMVWSDGDKLRLRDCWGNLFVLENASCEPATREQEKKFCDAERPGVNSDPLPLDECYRVCNHDPVPTEAATATAPAPAQEAAPAPAPAPAPAAPRKRRAGCISGGSGGGGASAHLKVDDE
jgi:pyruvate/2-oxoglutarate dehydrogenase complex dihydrolipoamide acyltransferase (E2) component